VARTIIIDSREAATAGEILQLLKQHFDVAIQPLESADYVLSPTGRMKGSIGIERKRVADLRASIIDNRLFSQVINLVDTYEYPILLIEGSLYPLYTEPILGGAYISLIYSFKDLRIAHTRDYHATVNFIKRSAMYAGPTGRVAPPLPEKRKLINPKRIKLSMLCCVRNIGEEKAQKINEALPELFKSPYAKEDLTQTLVGIKGIGRKTAMLIAEIFGR